MKRIIVSIVIIALIVALGCSAIAYIDSNNTRLYGHIDEILSAYSEGNDAELRTEIGELNRFFDKYEKWLSIIVNEEPLNDISASISRLMPMYESDSDEFTAECEVIRSYAAKIQKNEVPAWYRIF